MSTSNFVSYVGTVNDLMKMSKQYKMWKAVIDPKNPILPEGYEVKYTSRYKIPYYVNHVAKTTSWYHPIYTDTYEAVTHKSIDNALTYKIKTL